ncbi:MAG: hypothetical protein V1853_00715 [bacterium]
MSYSLSKRVWNRADESVGHDLSKTCYIGLVSGLTVYGLIIATVIAGIAMYCPSNSVWLVLGSGLGISLLGILVILGSDIWLASMSGYTIMIFGLGMIR